MTSGSKSELPAYSSEEATGSVHPNSERANQGSSASNVGDSAERPDRRANYALSVQKACNVALQRVKSNNVVANSNWASPLAAAPSAISTMAILLKAADKEAAAGLEIESQDVKGEDGTVKGKLPSKYFHTNLQHCSDVGRLAFLDAQHGMSTIQKTARSMISDSGSIGYIIDLLEDPEDARYNLKPEIQAIKATAKKCLDNAKAITAKFEYWYLVIIHLRQTSLSKRGEVVKEKEVTTKQQKDAAIDQEKLRNQQAALEAEIENVKLRVSAAERDVDRAQAEADRLRYEPIQPEPSVWEEIERMKRIIPTTAPPEKDRGMFVGVKDFFAGQSKEHEAEDKALREAHFKSIAKMQDAAMKQAQEARNHQRRLAAERLKQARDIEDKSVLALTSIYEKLSTSTYRLGEAKANLVKAQGEMDLLSNKEIELASIMKILDNSVRNLGKLKEQIEPLVDFFRTVLGEIDHNIEENMESFLRPIVNGMQKNSSKPDEVEAIHMGHRSKEKMMATALQMQGRFSAITDISTAYITISANYIRPAIHQMEALSSMTDSEWQIKSREFLAWCDNVMNEIDGVTQQTSANVDKNMAKHIDALKMRAIEAAADNEQ